MHFLTLDLQALQVSILLGIPAPKPESSNKATEKKEKMQLRQLRKFVAIVALWAAVMLSSVAQADFTEIVGGSPTTTLRNPYIPGASVTPPYQAPYLGQPPPIGSGSVPRRVIPGDLGNPSPPPTGKADPTHGNFFPTRSGQGTRIPSIYAPDAGRYPTAHGQQQGVFNGIEPLIPGDLGNPDPPPSGTADPTHGNIFPTRSGQGTKIPTIYQDGAGRYATQYGQQQGVLNEGGPLINAQKIPDRLFQHNKEQSKFDFYPSEPLPTVRTFCRYLVILGVVAATVWMAQAGLSVVFGHSHGASRVIGVAGGLILLLMGFTIWKIVQMNTFHFNSDDTPEWRYRNGATRVIPRRPDWVNPRVY